MVKYTRTPQSQSERKTSGTRYEHMVARDLQSRKFPKTHIYTKEGVDIRASNGVKIKVEVKATNRYENTTDGRKRTGRITLKRNDLEDADVVAVVIKDTDDIYYVRSSHIKEWLQSKGKYQSGKSTKITVTQIQKFPKAKLHYKE